jgi:hypothetical protein
MLIDIIERYIPLQIILILYGLSRWDIALNSLMLTGEWSRTQEIQKED